MGPSSRFELWKQQQQDHIIQNLQTPLDDDTASVTNAQITVEQEFQKKLRDFEEEDSNKAKRLKFLELLKYWRDTQLQLIDDKAAKQRTRRNQNLRLALVQDVERLASTPAQPGEQHGASGERSSTASTAKSPLNLPSEGSDCVMTDDSGTPGRRKPIQQTTAITSAIHKKSSASSDVSGAPNHRNLLQQTTTTSPSSNAFDRLSLLHQITAPVPALQMVISASREPSLSQQMPATSLPVAEKVSAPSRAEPVSVPQVYMPTEVEGHASPATQHDDDQRASSRISGDEKTGSASLKRKSLPEPMPDVSSALQAKRPRPAVKSSSPLTHRTVQFDEVYLGGRAKHPHAIHLHKGHFYICKCECANHTVHFKALTIFGAAKHMDSLAHNNAGRDRDLAVKTLGYVVLGCDEEKMKINNEAFQKRLDEGYTPVNTLKDNKEYHPRMARPASPDGQALRSNGQSQKPNYSARPLKTFNGIVDPTVGELYTGFWRVTGKSYIVMVLDWDDQKKCGIPGTLRSMGLLKPGKGVKAATPKCYVLTSDKSAIAGWAEGFEDGGPRVQQRQFPVIWFDSHNSLSRLQAKYLTKADLDTPSPEISLASYDKAKQHYARKRGFENCDKIVAKNQKRLRESMYKKRELQNALSSPTDTDNGFDRSVSLIPKRNTLRATTRENNVPNDQISDNRAAEEILEERYAMGEGLQIPEDSADEEFVPTQEDLYSFFPSDHTRRRSPRNIHKTAAVYDKYDEVTTNTSSQPMRALCITANTNPLQKDKESAAPGYVKIYKATAKTKSHGTKAAQPTLNPESEAAISSFGTLIKPASSMTENRGGGSSTAAPLTAGGWAGGVGGVSGGLARSTPASSTSKQPPKGPSSLPGSLSASKRRSTQSPLEPKKPQKTAGKSRLAAGSSTPSLPKNGLERSIWDKGFRSNPLNPSRQLLVTPSSAPTTTISKASLSGNMNNQLHEAPGPAGPLSAVKPTEITVSRPGVISFLDRLSASGFVGNGPLQPSSSEVTDAKDAGLMTSETFKICGFEDGTISWKYRPGDEQLQLLVNKSTGTIESIGDNWPSRVVIEALNVTHQNATSEIGRPDHEVTLWEKVFDKYRKIKIMFHKTDHQGRQLDGSILSRRFRRELGKMNKASL